MRDRLFSLVVPVLNEEEVLADTAATLTDPALADEFLDVALQMLAPIIVQASFHFDFESVAELRKRGFTIVLVEQYLTYALRLADICYVLAKGHIEFVGEPNELRDSEALASSYLGAG